MAFPAIKPNQLRLPAESSKHLARPHLLLQLAHSVEAGCFTLLQAPLGYGKSTLLSQFARTQPGSCAWLRLTPAENQPLGLLVHLHAALQLPAGNPGTTDVDELWLEIQQHLESTKEPITLVIDELQLLSSPLTYQYLEQLLHFPPPALRLLAASEGPPHLPLAHLRRDARLKLIDTYQLALNSEESRQLATARGVQLSADAIYQLRAGSEGWISGILFWLDAYREAVESKGQPPVDLRPVTVQAYAHARQFLEEERLLRLKPELLAFLERTAVVQVFDAALASELSEQDDARKPIRRLRRLDLFIEERAGERSEYRYHPALRNSLYQRLQQREPQRLRLLHLRAANWFLEQRRFTEAIYQFGRAKDFEAVLATVDRHTFDLLREGQVNTLVDFLSEVAGNAGSDSFTLAITEASTVIVTNDIAYSCQCLHRLRRLLRHQDAPRHPQRVEQTIAFLRSRMAYLGGNLLYGLKVAGRSLRRFPQHNAASSILHFDRASCLFALGRLDEARDEAELALCELQDFGLSGYTNLLQLLLGQIELAQGSGEAAWQRFLEMGNQPASSSGSFYELFHHLGKGLALLQTNQLEQARQCLNQAEIVALNFPHCAALAWVFHHQACLHWAQGDARQAKARWDEVRRMTRKYRLFTLYRQAGAWRARLAVREHDQDFLLAWLEEWHWCFRRYGENLLPEEWQAYAWVQLHLGQHDKAWQIHANLMEQAQTQNNRRQQLEALQFEAALSLDQGARSEALCSLDQALQLASQFGFGQLLQYEGAEQLELLRLLLLPQTREQLGLVKPVPAREQLNALFRRQLTDKEPTDQALIVPLSRRELDVLQRMAGGQTNQQIADALFISLSTVKTHINNLFRKLEVNDRDSALRAARELDLLN